MEGPTPVSALIHAATMVTAGVYLIARTHPIFEQARTVELVAAGMGALTLLVAGLIALVQTDIKRVIAYSTMSQIGYMFLGAGIGAYANGMFHLMTHAFFKALLFMAAGLVIHALADEQDIRKMGGIGKLMPWTRWAFLAGALALVGMPPFARLLLEGLDHRRRAARRLVRRHLLGRRADRHVPDRALHVPALLHRLRRSKRSRVRCASTTHGITARGRGRCSCRSAILAVLAVIGGWIQFAPFWHPLTNWLAPVAPTLAVAEPTDWQEALSSVLAVALGLAGIAVAWAMYGTGRLAVPQLPARAARARAQALLRRGVRRALLPAGRGVRVVAAP